ncbi:hypothetical protein [Pedobacter sp. JCM 36344]|uniref:hypothetical protein n=1 Tax=Pedobacter sp. JCM 36344 TaxID=3374280 RepID=UPI00397CD3B4
MEAIKIKSFMHDGTVEIETYASEKAYKKRKLFKDTKAYQILDIVTNVVLRLILIKKAAKS